MTIQFLLGTFNYGTSLWFLTQAYVDHRLDTAGPSVWMALNEAAISSQINNGLSAVAICLGDGVLVGEFPTTF
jgi:hypothetical protein